MCLETNTMSANCQRVLIIQDGSKDPCIVAVKDVVNGFSLKWGDKIELLCIIQAFRENNILYPQRCGSLPSEICFSALFGKRFSPIKLHSSATIYKRKEDLEERTQKTLKRYANCAEFKEMQKIATSLQVEFEIAVEAGLLKEVAVEYAKNFQATHVILHRQLGKECKYFVQNLTCGISRMKFDNTIEIVRPSHVDKDATATVEEATPSLETREHRRNINFTCSYCMNIRPQIVQKKKFTYAELQIATNGFCPQNLMSDHGRRIYLGLLNYQRQILIREVHSVTIGEENFQRKVQILEGIRHENVALLIGSCSEGQHKFLVYEYVCNGSLNKHLSNKDRKLTWERRISIVYGAARGLEYLHQEGIYGCMRPSNILITHDYQPMLSYYGLMNNYEATEQSHEKSAIKTFEHLAPEYQETGRDLSKADVYSFGVVLLELITGRKSTEDTNGQSFLRWARPLLTETKYNELIDPDVVESVDIYQLLWLVRIADKSLRWDPKKRYSMRKVVRALAGMINRSGVDDFSPTQSEF